MGALLSTTSSCWQTLTRPHALQQATRTQIVAGNAGGGIRMSEPTHQYLPAHSETMATNEATGRRDSIDATNAPTTLRTSEHNQDAQPERFANQHDQRKSADALRQMLASFARFKWPRKTEDALVPSFKHSVVDEMNTLSSDPQAEVDAQQQSVAMARHTNSTQGGMHTLDEELLKHLRAIHDAWRRSFDDCAPSNDGRKSGNFPYHCLWKYCARQDYCVEADSLIDALDGSFGPTLRARRESADSDVSELDRNNSAALSDEEGEEEQQAILWRRASAPSQKSHWTSTPCTPYTELMTASI